MKAAIGGERDYIARMLDLPATRVFFTSAQREAIRGRWCD
jgi:hypothetical protein